MPESPVDSATLLITPIQPQYEAWLANAQVDKMRAVSGDDRPILVEIAAYRARSDSGALAHE